MGGPEDEPAKARALEGLGDSDAIDLAVGGDWPGNPDASTQFPGYMDINWIRVYKK